LITHDGAATVRPSGNATGVDAYTVLFESWQQWETPMPFNCSTAECILLQFWAKNDLSEQQNARKASTCQIHDSTLVFNGADQQIPL